MGKQALLTDLGNVLVSFWERTTLVTTIIKGFGGDAAAVEKVFPDAKKFVKGEGIYRDLDSGHLNFRDFWQHICTTAGVACERLPYHLFFAMWCRHLQPIESVVAFYQKLSVPIIAVSNGDEGARYAVHMLEVFYELRFREAFISYERHQTKPDLLVAVKRWLAKQGFDPDSCVFIDDLPEYVTAAVDIGFPAIQFDGTKQPVSILKKELAKFGIKETKHER